MRFKAIKGYISIQRYIYYAPIVQNILKTKLPYQHLKNELNLPFNSIQEYLDLIHPNQFKNLSELDNLNFFLGFRHLKEKLYKDVWKKILYPGFLFVLSLVLTIYFTLVFAPLIISMMEDFKVSANHLIFVHKVSYCVMILWMIVLLSLSILSIFLTNKAFRFVFYIRYHDKKFMSIVKNILTARFAFVYHFLLQNVLITKQIIEDVKSLETFSDIKWCTHTIESGLLKGRDLNEIIAATQFNSIFILYFKNGFMSGNLIESLETFKNTNDIVIKAQFNKIIAIFKGCVYVYIFIYISLFYIFLFQPLSILEGIS